MSGTIKCAFPIIWSRRLTAACWCGKSMPAAYAISTPMRAAASTLSPATVPMTVISIRRILRQRRRGLICTAACKTSRRRESAPSEHGLHRSARSSSWRWQVAIRCRSPRAMPLLFAQGRCGSIHDGARSASCRSARATRRSRSGNRRCCRFAAAYRTPRWSPTARNRVYQRARRSLVYRDLHSVAEKVRLRYAGLHARRLCRVVCGQFARGLVRTPGQKIGETVYDESHVSKAPIHRKRRGRFGSRTPQAVTRRIWSCVSGMGHAFYPSSSTAQLWWMTGNHVAFTWEGDGRAQISRFRRTVVPPCA